MRALLPPARPGQRGETRASRRTRRSQRGKRGTRAVDGARGQSPASSTATPPASGQAEEGRYAALQLAESSRRTSPVPRRADHRQRIVAGATVAEERTPDGGTHGAEAWTGSAPASARRRGRPSTSTDRRRCARVAQATWRTGGCGATGAPGVGRQQRREESPARPARSRPWAAAAGPAGPASQAAPRRLGASSKPQASRVADAGDLAAA